MVNFGKVSVVCFTTTCINEGTQAETSKLLCSVLHSEINCFSLQNDITVA